MKQTLVVLEDDFDRLFVTKQLIECQLRIPTSIKTVTSVDELHEALASSHGLLCPDHEVGALSLLRRFMDLGVNRRNSVIVFVYADDVPDGCLRVVRASKHQRMLAA